MKKVIISAAFLTASIITFAQSSSHGLSRNNNEVSPLSVTNFNNPDDAQKAVTEIMNVMGLKQNFILRPANVSNVEAFVSKRKRYILYNPEFIGWINNSTKDKWASVALLAHEIGHHLNGHTLGRGVNSQFELDADEFAGFVMRKLGASLEQSQRVMYYIAKAEKSETHPAREDRMLAIKIGWSKAAVAPATTNSEMAINNHQDSSQNVLSN